MVKLAIGFAFRRCSSSEEGENIVVKLAIRFCFRPCLLARKATQSRLSFAIGFLFRLGGVGGAQVYLYLVVFCVDQCYRSQRVWSCRRRTAARAAEAWLGQRRDRLFGVGGRQKGIATTLCPVESSGTTPQTTAVVPHVHGTVWHMKRGDFVSYGLLIVNTSTLL